MGYTPSKKLLKPDAVPTIFSHRPAGKKKTSKHPEIRKKSKDGGNYVIVVILTFLNLHNIRLLK